MVFEHTKEHAFMQKLLANLGPLRKSVDKDLGKISSKLAKIKTKLTEFGERHCAPTLDLQD